MKTGISVVIVTHNGAERLLPTLEHLANQKFLDFEVELLVIDNNSNDNTKERAHRIWNGLRNPFKIRIIQESTPGTMIARKRGIIESRYRYVLFCDDDNWLVDSYLKTAYDLITGNPEIAALGGMGIMQYEHNFDPPQWLGPYERNFGTGRQGRVDGDTTNDKGCLYTAGTTFDKFWLNNLYESGFDSSLIGRDGKSLVAGEDTELTYALKRLGGKLYFSSELKFRHFMPSTRIKWQYLKNLWWAFGYSDFIISPYHQPLAEFKYSKYISKVISTGKEIAKMKLRTFSQENEGDISVLRLQRKKGEFKAMLYELRRYRQNKEMVRKLNQAKYNSAL